MVIQTLRNHWQTFSKEEQNLLLCFSPFRGAINFGESIISEYFEKLVVLFPDLPIPRYRQIINKCDENGWIKSIEAFPETDMRQLQPWVSSFLKKEALETLGKETSSHLEVAYMEYYKWLGQQLYDMYFYTPPGERQENLDFLDLELENLQTALWLFVKYKRYDFTEIFLAINTYLFASQQDELRRIITEKLRTILDGRQESDNDNALKFSLVDIYDSLGAVSLHLGKYEESEEYFKKALELYEVFSLSDQYPEALRTLLQNLGAVTAFQENWEESNAYYSKMIEVAEQHEDAEGIADYYLNYGKNLLNLQHYDQAFDFFARAVNYYQELKLPDWEALALKYQGMIKTREKVFDEAPLFFEKALAIFETLNDLPRKASMFNEYSLLYLGKKDFVKAFEYAQKAIEIYIQADMLSEKGIAYLNLCSASVGLEEFDQCEDYLRQAVEIFLREKDTNHLKTAVRIAGLLDNHNQSQVLSGLMDLILEVYSYEEIAEIFEL